jgi:hypothetical protein
MTRRVTVKIRPDGTIEAETHGMYGAECDSVVPKLQALLQARITKQVRTDDYRRTQPIDDNQPLHGGRD